MTELSKANVKLNNSAEMVAEVIPNEQQLIGYMQEIIEDKVIVDVMNLTGNVTLLTFVSLY